MSFEELLTARINVTVACIIGLVLMIVAAVIHNYSINDWKKLYLNELIAAIFIASASLGLVRCFSGLIDFKLIIVLGFNVGGFLGLLYGRRMANRNQSSKDFVVVISMFSSAALIGFSLGWILTKLEDRWQALSY